jgi:hypothetical protein
LKIKAVSRVGAAGPWQLQPYLPEESRQYVKKFIATLYFFEGQSSLRQFCVAG